MRLSRMGTMNLTTILSSMIMVNSHLCLPLMIMLIVVSHSTIIVSMITVASFTKTEERPASHSTHSIHSISAIANVFANRPRQYRHYLENCCLLQRIRRKRKIVRIIIIFSHHSFFHGRACILLMFMTSLGDNISRRAVMIYLFVYNN